jgi:hypothetical protein
MVALKEGEPTPKVNLRGGCSQFIDFDSPKWKPVRSKKSQGRRPEKSNLKCNWKYFQIAKVVENPVVTPRKINCWHLNKQGQTTQKMVKLGTHKLKVKCQDIDKLSMEDL